MRKSIPNTVKELVRKRAAGLCEYCLFPEEESFLTYHIEHIVSLKHRGGNSLENLALSCPLCNMAKGTDISTLVGKNAKLTRLFHPRKDIWDNHFNWDGVLIIPKSLVGEGTIALLKMNDVDRLIDRQNLLS